MTPLLFPSSFPIMPVWFCQKNESENMEESNLICNLARTHYKNPKIPKKVKKKVWLAHINHHSDNEFLIHGKTVTLEFWKWSWQTSLARAATYLHEGHCDQKKNWEFIVGKESSMMLWNEMSDDSWNCLLIRFCFISNYLKVGWYLYFHNLIQVHLHNKIFYKIKSVQSNPILEFMHLASPI